MAIIIKKLVYVAEFLTAYVYHFCAIYAVAVVAVCKQWFEPSKHLKTEYPSQHGNVIIITGGATGIGLQVTMKLAALGGHVIMASRCPREGMNALKTIWRANPSAKVEFIQLDLSSRTSVTDFSTKFKQMGLPLHMLINNAATMMVPFNKTVDGVESHLAINYAGHWLLTQNLSEALRKGGTSEKCSRVVNISSVCHHAASFPDYLREANKLQMNGRSSMYSPHAAYAQSKLLQVMHAYTLQRTWSSREWHVTACALHPGVTNTALYRHVIWPLRVPIRLLGRFLLKAPEQAARVVLRSVLGGGSGGQYYSAGSPCRSSAVSYDEDLQKTLWNNTCDLWDRADDKI